MIEEQTDIDALLGKITETDNTSSNKQELTVHTGNDLSNKELKSDVIANLQETLLQSNNAVSAALNELSMTPSDPALIASVSSLLNAHTKAMEAYQKMYIFEQKHEQNKELLTMKLMTQDKMNKDNNDTKILLTREEIIKNLTKNKNIIEA